ncbi:hypothetical protein [Rhodococcus sp. H29-C3]|uniref:hypothetical protein n=1 Tax=Rhodococcus sp. H29-C3 TaxID=3046307 RepID=UPI0024B88B54|nr:hypothetical protein [Rhodococcus sp. H29-C3]MDJ0360688.1 hypothetical protein [Rhodococcus sp. H29-C3]
MTDRFRTTRETNLLRVIASTPTGLTLGEISAVTGYSVRVCRDISNVLQKNLETAHSTDKLHTATDAGRTALQS